MNYKRVGAVLSPLYFSTEKPATTLGSGKIDYYAYTLDGNIKNDVYTNIYITVSNAKDELTNNNKYKSLIENVKNAYRLKKCDICLKNKNILLRDDVFTTGSTVNECAKILLQTECNKVSIITLAKDWQMYIKVLIIMVIIYNKKE